MSVRLKITQAKKKKALKAKEAAAAEAGITAGAEAPNLLADEERDPDLLDFSKSK